MELLIHRYRIPPGKWQSASLGIMQRYTEVRYQIAQISGYQAGECFGQVSILS
jgi:hypothetical protein